MSRVRPIILVGLSGAGKSTAARLAAPLLGTGWIDLDDRISARAGKSIAELFAEQGEGHFRALEQQEMLGAIAEPPQVIAAGAGWVAEPGNLGAVTPAAFVVYLSIGVAEAARRLAGVADRPLLAGTTLGERLAGQLAVREGWYRQADIEISVDGVSPEMAAEAIVAAAKHYGGW